MSHFEFATSGRIVFGQRSRHELGQIVSALGMQVLLVTGDSERGRRQGVGLFEGWDLTLVPFAIPHEPTIDLIRQGVKLARAANVEVVVGIGGGAVLDAAKAIAALAANEGDPLDYLEVIGLGRTLEHDPLPYVAVPTTAGTGAEVTRNAVLASPQHQVKVSLRSPKMLPRVALIDPTLMVTLSPAMTASTGMDALTQNLEPFVSASANPITDTFCREGMVRVSRSLRRAFHHGDDLAAREDMALAALFGGLALANAKLGAVHGFAAPIGGMFDAPHGAVCAVLLAPVMQANLRALSERAPHSPALVRYQEVARLLTNNPQATAADGVAWVQSLTRDLAIPALGTYGMLPQHLTEIAEKASQASSMKGNPIELTQTELVTILEQAL